MEQRLSLLTLGVKNLKSMRSFYEEKFEWKAEVANDNIVLFKLNGFFLGLFSEEALAEDAGMSPQRSGFKPCTLAQNYFSMEEVDQVFAKLKEQGVKIVKAPEKVFWGGYRGYIADPEDNLWEIAYNPFMHYDAQGNVLGHDTI